MPARTAVGCVGVALAVGGAFCPAGRAWAGDPFNLRDLLFGPQTRKQPHEFDVPDVARYQADAMHGFVFDRLGGREALIKYDNDPEIWALTATQGPRGDVIYKNDTGEPVVRLTRLGGMTLFTPSRPDGAAAALLGEAPPPRPENVIGLEALQFIAVQASARASRAAQHLIEFDAPDITPTPSSEVVFADAFFVTAQAFMRVSQGGPPGQQLLTRVMAVRFLAGPAPSAQLRGPTVQITVTPQLGIAGRPSSGRIAQVITHH